MNWKSAIAALGLVALAAQPVAAHEGEAHGDVKSGPEVTNVTIPKADPARVAKAREYFTDLPVITQDGETLRFYTDVLADQIVVVSLFYSNCDGACPLTNAKLAELQELLRDQLGHGVRFLSITLDPERDTPDVLKEYATKFEAQDGWLFLTGKKEDLKKITYRLGQTDPMFEAHQTYFMVGNVNRAHWTRVMPNLPATAIAQQVQLMTQVMPGQ